MTKNQTGGGLVFFVFGKSRQQQLIVAKLTKLYRIHLYKKTFI